MTTLRQAWARLIAFFRKQQLDRDFDEELRAHLELATQDYLRQGISLPEARRMALIKLGGIEPSKELHRDSRGLPWLDGIAQDVRFAVRSLRRSPGFALAAIATLAIGIGVNAAVFTVMNATLFRGFRLVKRNDRLVYIGTEKNGAGLPTSIPDFEDWRAQSKSFKGMAAYLDTPVALNDKGDLEWLIGSRVTSNTFSLLGQRPILGRDFLPSDEKPGAAPVAILTYGFWESQYAKNPAIIGHVARVNGVPTEVIGVMPQDFLFPNNEDLWMPLVPTPDLEKRQNRRLWFAVGRLADGVTRKSAQAEMQVIGRRLASAYPLTNQGVVPHVHSFAEFFFGANANAIYLSMWGAVGFVLLIACANLANLTLARSMSRSREISVRVALGAGRWRIIRQLLVESALLSSVGATIGWWVADWSVRIYKLLLNPPGVVWQEPQLDYSMDHRVFAYILAISVGTAILFGLAPAIRLSKLDANASLKNGGLGAIGGARRNRLSSFLVIAEVGFAVVLLAGAGVMIRSFLKIYAPDPGFQTENLLTMGVNLPASRYPDASTQISFFDHLKTRLKSIPGVESVALASSLPVLQTSKLAYEIEGATPADEQRRPTVPVSVIGADYFRTLGVSVISGRDFNERDGVSGIPVAIVNERFANTMWPGEDPLGKRLRLFDGQTSKAWLTVVGVARNISDDRYMQQPTIDPFIYLPYREEPRGAMYLIARTGVPPLTLENAIRREVQAIDPDLRASLFVLSGSLAAIYWRVGLYAAVFFNFAAIALLIASVGLYAVVAHSVGQRTQEIGIRMAVGATARDILQLVFTQGMLPVGIGLTMGIAASFAVNRILKAELVQVSPSDPTTLIAVSAVLVLFATLGCWIPARRATRVDPVVALRNE